MTLLPSHMNVVIVFGQRNIGTLVVVLYTDNGIGNQYKLIISCFTVIGNELQPADYWPIQFLQLSTTEGLVLKALICT